MAIWGVNPPLLSPHGLPCHHFTSLAGRHNVGENGPGFTPWGGRESAAIWARLGILLIFYIHIYTHKYVCIYNYIYIYTHTSMYVSLWHICEDQLDKSHISGLYCRVNVEWGDYLTTKNQKRQTKSELISSLENDETSLVVSWTILDLDVHITLSLPATPVFRAPKGVLHIPMVTLKAWYLLGILQDLQLKTYPNILSRNLLNRICCDNHQKMGFTTQTSLATCNNCSHPLATERQVCTRSPPRYPEAQRPR